jgi:alpha-beta hydrolase superfamily lysophospholipase
MPLSMSRRSVVSGALALGVTTASTVAPMPPSALAAESGKTGLSTEEFWVTEGEVRLYVYRKQADEKRAHRPVLLLSHGSSISSVPSYDLRVPGKSDFSMMDFFAHRGFDVWTFDYEGYGKSSRTGGNSNIARGVFDLKKVADFIHAKTGEAKLFLSGESSGALRAGGFAEKFPDQVSGIALSSFSYMGEGSTTLSQRKEQLHFYQTHDRRPRDRNMILSIFTRDKPGTYDPAVPEALANMELAIPDNDTVPTGTYLDMVTILPVVDPKKNIVPTILLRGEYDGIATESDVLGYFSNIACADREYRLIAGATHALGLGNRRFVAWGAIADFFESDRTKT